MAVAHGVSQVMFQASVWTGLVVPRRHRPERLASTRRGCWSGSIVGTLVGSYHVTAAARVLDPESLVDRGLLENVVPGALRLQRDAGGRRLVPVAAVADPADPGDPALGSAHRALPVLGLPALTAPFVLATWTGSGARLARRRLFRARIATPTSARRAGRHSSASIVGPGSWSTRPCIFHPKNATSC